MIISYKIRLREKRIIDALNDYTWHADKELALLDAMLPLTMTYAQYLADYTYELRYLNLRRRSFGIETLDGKHIGNCAYYRVDENRGDTEIGIMIGDRDYWNKGYGTDAIMTLGGHIFGETSLSRIYLKTLDWNHRAQKCFEKCGFTACGDMDRSGYRFVLMEMHRQQWEDSQDGE